MIGGQLVHLHRAERGQFPARPTNDADTVDVRVDPKLLRIFTSTLVELGFTSSGVSAEGLDHRRIRGAATVDVLPPEGIGERAAPGWSDRQPKPVNRRRHPGAREK